MTIACARETPRAEMPAPPLGTEPQQARVEPGPSPAAPAAPFPGSSSASGGGLAERYATAAPLAVFSGEASYYSDKLAGRSTASGEPYDPRALTAAHRSLPFGTVVRVVRSGPPGAVYVRINDRGPFVRGRVLDLSRAAAEALSMVRAGVIPVRAEVVEFGAKSKPKKRRQSRRRR